MGERRRLDALLVERGLVSGRDRAKDWIAHGYVRVGGRQVLKPATMLEENALITVKPTGPVFVGRGGEKLERALEAFRIDPNCLFAMDVGASTGGFTDCLLRRGAARVYAIDVGTGQLSAALRGDPRVENLEQTDIRTLRPGTLAPAPSLAVCDVSFISLKLVLPAICAHLTADGTVVALVKPQFEAGRGAVGKHGVVRDRATHLRVLTEVLDAAAACGLGVRGLVPSPIPGGDGNREYLLWLRRGGESAVPDLRAVIADAFDPERSEQP
jgi:23S rRNA (cytidine1920-2'-O)/16S rRNA (cytidine1409-2'-O)-methyltransferase